MQPLLSVGLAVYNGERYIHEAINSILSQSFTDFELIISDNASTDNTRIICLDYASKDKRIRYRRNDRNIGGANNENLTFHLSQGKYFRWAAHDDICLPTLFEKCVHVLETDQDVILAHSIFNEIDNNGKYIRTVNRNKATSNRSSSRFRELIGWDHNCEELYGIIRSDVLRKTKLQLNYTDSDRTLLCELALYGKFFQIPEQLFYRRIHSEMSTVVYSDWRKRMEWFDISNKERAVFPHWQQFFHYLEIISKVPMPLCEKTSCYLHMVDWLIRKQHARYMMKDLYLATIKTITNHKK
jgi:glycosyltransferase involved in cell wall biosynthesis